MDNNFEFARHVSIDHSSMVRALRASAVNQQEDNSVRNLQYGSRTRLVRGVHMTLR